jgi:NAD(P)H-nitrite reductase large subunit
MTGRCADADGGDHGDHGGRGHCPHCARQYGIDSTPGAGQVRLIDPVGGMYRSVTIRAGRVFGSALIGDISAAPRPARLADRSEPLPGSSLDLLFDPAERN